MFEQEEDKKIRKSFNGRWSQAQHNRFMKGLQKYGRDWNSLQKIVKSRTISQIRSHAQKVFLKMEKRDIEALIQRQEKDEESTYFQITKKRRVKQEPNVKKGTLFESFKKCFAQQEQQEKVSPAQSMQIEQKLQNKMQIKQIAFEIQASFFTKILLENYEHFEKGGNFLNIYNTNVGKEKQGFQLYRQKKVLPE